MARSIRTYTSFAGGQNNFQGAQASPILVDNGQTEALFFAHASQNWWMSEAGLIKYPGNIAVLASALSGTPILAGLYEWKSKSKTIACAGGKVYTISGSTATQIYTGHTAGKFYQFTEWVDSSGNDILIMCNGTDTPLYYDNTTCTTISFTDDASVIWNNAKPKGATVKSGNIFYWGDPTKPHRVYKPRPGTHNNFDNTDKTVEAFDVDGGYGGYVTGMQSFTNDITIIYKQRCIRRMEGVNPFGSSVDPITVLPITDEYGCVAPRTIIAKGLDHYFLSQDGYRKLEPVQAYGNMTDDTPTYPIQNIINGLNFSDGVIDYACAVFDKSNKQIWLSVPDGASTTNNQVIIHNVVTGGNDLRLDGDINAAVLAIVNRKVNHGDYAGQIYKNGDDYTYNGMAVDAEWESKYIAHNGLGTRKNYREMHIYAESDGAGSLICQYTTLQRDTERAQATSENIASGANVWDTATWDVAQWGSGSQQVFKIEDLGEGNAIKFKLINNASNQNVKIRAVEIHYDILNSSRG